MPTFTKSAMERLAKSSDAIELWWDSNPLIFNAWVKKMVEKAAPGDKELIKKQLKVLFDDKNPSETLFCGVTTNPRLSKKFWILFLKKLIL